MTDFQKNYSFYFSNGGGFFYAESFEHFKDILKCKAFRRAYRAIARYCNWTYQWYHEVYSLDEQGNLNKDDCIGYLWKGEQ